MRVCAPGNYAQGEPLPRGCRPSDRYIAAAVSGPSLRTLGLDLYYYRCGLYWWHEYPAAVVLAAIASGCITELSLSHMVAGEAALRILSTKMIKVPDVIALVTVKLSGGSWQPLMQILGEIETHGVGGEPQVQTNRCGQR